MTSQILSLSFRPKTFNDLVGQEHIVKRIRKHIESGRIPSAWMLSGATGSGKSTIAKILALSLQCPHQKEFGQPCKICRKNRSQFDIIEINAAEASGIDETEGVITGAFYSPKPPSKYRVYIFDEAHGLSPTSQRALLKYFEESPKTTIWIVCTTDPAKIHPTLRRRCLSYSIPPLDRDGVSSLVQKAIEFSKADKPTEPLVDALCDAGVYSPGLIVMAVEKYLAGEKPRRAAQVLLDSSIDTLAVCRAVINGSWDTVQGIMLKASPEDARAVRASVAGYLKAVLLKSEDGSKAKKAARAIKELSSVSWEDGVQLAATCAALWKICQYFGD